MYPGCVDITRNYGPTHSLADSMQIISGTINGIHCARFDSGGAGYCIYKVTLASPIVVRRYSSTYTDLHCDSTTHFDYTIDSLYIRAYASAGFGVDQVNAANSPYRYLIYSSVATEYFWPGHSHIIFQAFRYLQLDGNRCVAGTYSSDLAVCGDEFGIFPAANEYTWWVNVATGGTAVIIPDGC